MNIFILHPSFPAQYLNIAPYLARNPDNNVYFCGLDLAADISTGFQHAKPNELENSNKTQNTSSFTITSNLKFTFTDWLNANFVLSYTEQSTDQEGYWGDKTYYVATLRGCNFGEPIPIESASLLPQGGELSVNNIHDRNVMGRIQLNANK